MLSIILKREKQDEIDKKLKLFKFKYHSENTINEIKKLESKKIKRETIPKKRYEILELLKKSNKYDKNADRKELIEQCKFLFISDLTSYFHQFTEEELYHLYNKIKKYGIRNKHEREVFLSQNRGECCYLDIDFICECKLLQQPKKLINKKIIIEDMDYYDKIFKLQQPNKLILYKFNKKYPRTKLKLKTYEIRYTYNTFFEYRILNYNTEIYEILKKSKLLQKIDINVLDIIMSFLPGLFFADK